MTAKIFFSWQSDIEGCRRLVREALDLALSELNTHPDVVEAGRELTADQDTQNVPGTPPVAETILQKVREAYAFVSDLTFVNNPPEGRRHPNPNVLLEYGYALHALGDGRIIGVMNTAYGRPEDLPFDLLHRRWPIRYSYRTGDNRAAALRSLADNLKMAISSIVSQFGFEDERTIANAAIQPAGNIQGRLRLQTEVLCTLDDGQTVELQTGPFSYMKFVPTPRTSRLTNVQARAIVRNHVQAMARGIATTGYGRDRNGAVNYWAAGDTPRTAAAASEVFLTGEIWGNDTHFLNPTHRVGPEEAFRYIPTSAFEQMFVDTFINYADASRHQLGSQLPILVYVGLIDASQYRLAVDPNHFMFSRFEGVILDDHISYSFTIEDWRADPFDLLKPFFDLYYDAAGLERPATRVVGQRQR